jgi:cyclopropane fatty-acyl-phospholipid synthase-like methyltransferase
MQKVIRRLAGFVKGTRSTDWREFWEQKDNPLHSSSDALYYDRLAAELRLILPVGFRSVLDVGCGNGVFFRRLGFDQVTYKGIDFSPAMIEKYKADYPEADVAVADVRAFKPGAGLDLIFSHGVVQNLTLAEFRDLCRRSFELLEPGGYAVHAGVLWNRMRTTIAIGDLSPKAPSLLFQILHFAGDRVGAIKSMGHWYSIRKVRKIATTLGFSVTFHGSVLYPYRFHVVMQKHSKS